MEHNPNFIERLEQLMAYYGLTASSFADRIRVQRSGISHLLSGRNKPSLDFILKLADEFPEVNLYWLLKGIGDFIGDEKPQPATPLPDLEQQVNVQKPISMNEATGDVERIVWFYRDGHFREFRPDASK